MDTKQNHMLISHRDPPSSDSQILGLKVYAITPRCCLVFESVLLVYYFI